MFLREEMPYILNIKRNTMVFEHVGISLVLLFLKFLNPNTEHLLRFAGHTFPNSLSHSVPIPNFLSLVYLEETNYDLGF